MPFFEYECPKCHEVRQIFRQPYAEVPEYIECETCSTKRVRVLCPKKIPTGVSVIWKEGSPTKRFYK